MAGTYTEIVEIVAPSSAVAGDLVFIEAKVKNKYSATIGILVAGALEYGVSPWPSIEFAGDQANVEAGAVQSFSGYFYMPSSDTTIHIYSYYYGTDGTWHFDDEKTKKITVAELVPEVSQFKIADYSVV